MKRLVTILILIASPHYLSAQEGTQSRSLLELENTRVFPVELEAGARLQAARQFLLARNAYVRAKQQKEIVQLQNQLRDARNKLHAANIDNLSTEQLAAIIKTEMDQVDAALEQFRKSFTLGVHERTTAASDHMIRFVIDQGSRLGKIWNWEATAASGEKAAKGAQEKP